MCLPTHRRGLALPTRRARRLPLSSCAPNARILSNWLQVLGTAERSQVAQRLGHHLHAIVPVLETFKAEPQPLERIFPGKGPLAPPPQGMEGGVDQPLAPALGALAVAGGLGAVGAHPRLEKALAIRSGVKAAVKRDPSASPVQPARCGQAFQG